MKNILAKALLTTTAAGALVFAAPTQSQAQVSFGVRFGVPARAYIAPRRVYVEPRAFYVAPPVRYGYYERRDAEIRHEEWLREHRFDRDDHRYDRGYGYR